MRSARQKSQSHAPALVVKIRIWKAYSGAPSRLRIRCISLQPGVDKPDFPASSPKPARATVWAAAWKRLLRLQTSRYLCHCRLEFTHDTSLSFSTFYNPKCALNITAYPWRRSTPSVLVPLSLSHPSRP